MKILVIGQSVVDEIETDNKQFIKPGGIFYSVLGLSQITESTDEIFLLTNYTLKDKELFSSAFDRANLKFSNEVDNIPTVKLKIWIDRERSETYSNVNQKLIIHPGIKFNEFRGILVNMISGYDITFNELEQIRNNYKGIIYFDVHSLARGVDRKGDRNFRKIKQITKWLNNVDILQCNESELLTLHKSTDEVEIAKFVLSNRPVIFIITKGKNGTTLYYKTKNVVNKIDAIPIKVNGKNNVGCGDIFGASFFYFYLTTGDIKAALNKANTCAGLFTQYSAITEFQKLRKDFTNYNA